jgi:uncharacterized protein (UPF0335 family)
MINFRNPSLDGILNTFTKTKAQLEQFIERTERYAATKKSLAAELKREADDLEAEAIRAEVVKKNIIKMIG